MRAKANRPDAFRQISTHACEPREPGSFAKMIDEGSFRHIFTHAREDGMSFAKVFVRARGTTEWLSL
jgi:hypothetical protein